MGNVVNFPRQKTGKAKTNSKTKEADVIPLPQEQRYHEDPAIDRRLKEHEAEIDRLREVMPLYHSDQLTLVEYLFEDLNRIKDDAKSIIARANNLYARAQEGRHR